MIGATGVVLAVVLTLLLPTRADGIARAAEPGGMRWRSWVS